ncbi:hypothetical protein TNCV_4942391 [Trichonephila clavipes]|nr:hypothetical protein TNCV_4942391 [Trichonephila clavipes]
MTVNRIWNRWFRDGNTERRAGSQLPPITSRREDKHVTRMVLMDSAATPRTLSQDWGRLQDNKYLYQPVAHT